MEGRGERGEALLQTALSQGAIVIAAEGDTAHKFKFFKFSSTNYSKISGHDKELVTKTKYEQTFREQLNYLFFSLVKSETQTQNHVSSVLLSRAAAPVGIPSNSAEGFPFLCLLVNIC